MNMPAGGDEMDAIFTPRPRILSSPPDPGFALGGPGHYWNCEQVVKPAPFSVMVVAKAALTFERLAPSSVSEPELCPAELNRTKT